MNDGLVQAYVMATCIVGMVLIVLFAVSEVLGVAAIVLAGFIWLNWRGNWH